LGASRFGRNKSISKNPLPITIAESATLNVCQ
jgi:hypothetical protein